MKAFKYIQLIAVCAILLSTLHCKYEEVDPLAADFKVQGSNPSALAPVQFEDLSIGSTTWAWNFGNGQTHNGKTPPAQTFSTEGNYAVSLTVTNGKGDSDTKTLSVSVGPCTLPVANFSTSGTLQVGQNIVFNNQSTLNSNASTGSYLWNFGNGSTSTQQSPSSIFTNSGSYTVTLTTTTPCGSHSVQKALTVVAVAPSACFSVSNDNCTAPCTVSFTNCSQNATSYTWNFGDGTASSTVPNPSHTYQNSGNYTVTLTALLNGQTSSSSKTVTIMANPPSACFSVSNDNCTAPCTVSFTNCSQNATSYTWNFGNGNTSTVPNPSHNYENSGNYTVTLTALQNGLTSSSQKTVTIMAGIPSPTMVTIPATTTFSMGCNGALDICISGELPVRNVTLSSYLISETEITQTQWNAIMNSVGIGNPSNFNNCPECPVERVSWFDAMVFCNRLSELQNLTPCYYADQSYTQVYGKNGASWSLPNNGNVFWKPNTKGYRLPTEAEWERAARGGTPVSSNIYSGSNDNIAAVAVYFSNSGNKTSTVASKAANNSGLFDMSGNVWEWCWDWYDASYYGQTGNTNNPKGPGSGSSLVLRGGSWLSDPTGCRVAIRGGLTPDVRNFNFGFRLARTP